MRLPNLLAVCKKTVKMVFSLEKGSVSSQITRFLMVGGLAAAIDLGLLIILVEYMSFHYLLAGFLSFMLAVFFNYGLSRYWVFQGGRYSRGLEFFRFLGVSIIGLGLNQLTLVTLVGVFTINYKIAKIFSILLVAIWNFMAKKRFVFTG